MYNKMNKSLARFLLMLALIALPFGATGCKLSCESDTSSDIEDVVDEVGDEVEDTVDKIKEKS